MNATPRHRPVPLFLALSTVLACGVGVTTNATAQNAGPPAALRLTTDDVVARAIAQSYRVAEGRARSDGAKAAEAGRAAAGRPTVNLAGGYTRTNHVDEFGIQLPGAAPKIIYPDIPDNWRARLDLQWPLYTGGRLEKLEQAAGAEVEASEKDLETLEADTKLDALRAFWTLRMARESVRVVEESLARVESHLRDVKQMRDVGLVAPHDVLSIEARRSRERVLLIDANNAKLVAEADVRRAAGLPAGTPIELVLPAGEVENPTADPLALAALAKVNRPERQAIEHRVTALTSRQGAALSSVKPLVTLAAGADYARPNVRLFPRSNEWNPSFDIGLTVAWNAWDGGRAKADAAEAAAGVRAVEARLAEFDRVVEFDVTQRVADVAAAHAAVVAADDGKRAAAEAYRVIQERFRAGLISNSEVLDAQVVLVQAQLDGLRADTAVRLAHARLERTLGR